MLIAIILVSVALIIALFSTSEYSGGWNVNKVSSQIQRLYGVEPSRFIKMKHSGYVNIESGRKTAELRLDKEPYNSIKPGDIVAVYSACYPTTGIPIKIIDSGSGDRNMLITKYGKMSQPDLDPVAYYSKVYGDEIEKLYYIIFKRLD